MSLRQGMTGNEYDKKGKSMGETQGRRRFVQKNGRFVQAARSARKNLRETQLKHESLRQYCQGKKLLK